MLEMTVYNPREEFNNYFGVDEMHDIADYLFNRRIDASTTKWFADWRQELHMLYEQIDEWCQKIGWNLTRKMDFYVFCALMAKMNIVTDCNEQKRRYAYKGKKFRKNKNYTNTAKRSVGDTR